MKKNVFIKVLLLGLCVSIIIAPLSGCSKKRDENTLEIRYYVGGFGSTWLESAKTQFEAANEGVTVKLVPDQTIQSSATVYLKSGKNLSDIFMNQDCDWQYYVSEGWIEPLDDLYATEVDMLDGTKSTIKDFLSDDVSDFPYMTRRPGQGQSRPWVLPWSVLNCGIVYNEDVVLGTPRRAGSGNWTAPPATMAEMQEYIGDLNAANLKNSAGVTVKPFAIGINGGQWWLSFPMKVWWAQHQGVVTPTARATQLKQGSYYDFWDFGAPTYDFSKTGNVWAQEGIAKGLDTLKELLVSGGKYTNTIDKCEEKTGIDAEKAFVNGEAAFIFVGNWIQNEMRDFMPEGFNMKQMFVPTLDTAQINPATGNPYLINNAATSDVMFIPSQAPNKELAKKFLAFISSEKMMIEFSKLTGVARPYKYNPLDAETGGFTYPSYNKSAFEMYEQADFNITEYPINKGNVPEEERDTFVSYIYTYKKPEIFQGVTAGPSLSGILTKTGEQIMDAIVKQTNTDYVKWINDLGIKDLI